jgi:DsbC/DsbD-like thiol-disulfide interchange protein
MSERSVGRRRGLRGLGVIVLGMAPGLLVSLSPNSAVAEDHPVRRAELLLFGSGTTGRLSAGVYIELVPGWHLYWVNPGDAGLAPEVHWRLPAGFEPGPLLFPTPEKLVEGDIVSFGYRGAALLLCNIKTPRAVPAKTQFGLTAVLDWMACRESCLTGRETLTADPAAVTPAGFKRSRQILARFTARFPKPAAASLSAGATAKLVTSPRGWTIDIALSENAGSRVRDFFPYPLEGFVIAYSRISCRDGRVTIPVTPSGHSAAISRVSGLLITGDTGYEITLPVKR